MLQQNYDDDKMRVEWLSYWVLCSAKVRNDLSAFGDSMVVELQNENRRTREKENETYKWRCCMMWQLRNFVEILNFDKKMRQNKNSELNGTEEIKMPRKKIRKWVNFNLTSIFIIRNDIQPLFLFALFMVMDANITSFAIAKPLSMVHMNIFSSRQLYLIRLFCQSWTAPVCDGCMHMQRALAYSDRVPGGHATGPFIYLSLSFCGSGEVVIGAVRNSKSIISWLKCFWRYQFIWTLSNRNDVLANGDIPRALSARWKMNAEM